MDLIYKPNFAESKEYWKAYWAGEIIDRPAISIRCPRKGAPSPEWPHLVNGLLDPDTLAEQFGECVSQVMWLGESVPFLNPNFGPDQFAAWLGGDLRQSSVENEHTTWAVPVIDDWDADALNIDHPRGEWWERMLRFMERMAELGHGKFIPGVPDIHSNIDALAALRGPQELCVDLMDVPEKIDAAMTTVRRAFRPAFEGVEKAAGLKDLGYIGWLPFYCEERMAVLQCDFACMVSPEHFRRWILPALEEEASYLDHAVYHYDGPDALVHLDDVLSIEGIDAIQWVPGAGNGEMMDWLDVLVRMQNGGKGLYIGASVEHVKEFHRVLKPEGVLYDVWVSSEHEADALLAWLKTNT